MTLCSALRRFVAGTVLLCAAPLTFAAQPVGDCERLAIRDVRIFPAPNVAPIERGVILVSRGRIASVGSIERTRIPRGYCVFDMAGASALAGFWNSHIHLTRPVLLTAAAQSDADLQREIETGFTRWGFTTVFDLASTSEVALEIRARIAAGQVRGPRLLSVGAPFYPAGATPIYALPIYREFRLPSAEITTIEAAIARAQAQIGAGMDGIKLFTGSIQGGETEVAHMQAEQIRALAAAAHRLRKPVFAHPTDRRGLEVAIENGVDVLAHAAPLTGRWTEEDARRIAARKVALVPTLALFADAADPRTPVDVALQQVQALHAVGGRVLFGTDAGFTDRFDPAREMQLIHAAIGWDGLLDSLTTAPATQFGESSRRGRLVAGHAADLVLVKGNPAVDVSALGNVLAVLRAGQFVYRQQ